MLNAKTSKINITKPKAHSTCNVPVGLVREKYCKRKESYRLQTTVKVETLRKKNLHENIKLGTWNLSLKQKVTALETG